MRIAAPAALFVVLLLMTGCSKPVDLKQVLQITDVSTGFRDGGIVDGRNKIVPSITFRLKKSVDDSVRPLSLNLAFKRLPAKGVTPAPGQPADEDWDEVFAQSVPFQGNQTALLTYEPKAGYTGDPPQSRADIMKNSYFRDVRVHVFAKHSSSQWVEIGVYDVPRQLITQ
jgi:hypothetical protein